VVEPARKRSCPSLRSNAWRSATKWARGDEPNWRCLESPTIRQTATRPVLRVWGQGHAGPVDCSVGERTGGRAVIITCRKFFVNDQEVANCTAPVRVHYRYISTIMRTRKTFTDKVNFSQWQESWNHLPGGLFPASSASAPGARWGCGTTGDIARVAQRPVIPAGDAVRADVGRLRGLIKRPLQGGAGRPPLYAPLLKPRQDVPLSAKR
jgi:hypothetical protein